MQIKKVLFLTGSLKHYRVPILNVIAQNENIELTVAHSGEKISNESNFFEEIIVNEHKIGPFTFHGKDFVKFCNSYDIVVAMFYLQKISFMKLLFHRHRNYKIIYWGIGVKASQNSKFDSPTLLNLIRYHIAKKSDGMIFYTDYAAKKYIKEGVNKNKIFVMNNTVKVSNEITNYFTKDRIVFAGTLNKSKKIFLLLNAYLKASEKFHNLPMLDLVGNGVDFEEVKSWVAGNDMGERIIVHGAIYDEILLEAIFKKSLACISPGQAGLSVLTSFGHGVPFVTATDAITGGERLNIEDNINGVFFNNEEELEEIIIEIGKNPEKYLLMGENAKKYYYAYRTPEIMAQSFIYAVDYVSKQKKTK
jgi:glycosyltransferase involved in cell wall biosynthesis